MTASSSATPMQKLRLNRLSPRDWRNIRTGLLFTMPWIIGMLVFTLYPILASFYYSFTQYDIVSPPKFIGLENFRVLFLEDQQYHKAISNTAFYALIAIPLGLLVSFSVAMLLNMKVQGPGRLSHCVLLAQHFARNRRRRVVDVDSQYAVRTSEPDAETGRH